MKKLILGMLLVGASSCAHAMRDTGFRGRLEIVHQKAKGASERKVLFVRPYTEYEIATLSTGARLLMYGGVEGDGRIAAACVLQISPQLIETRTPIATIQQLPCSFDFSFPPDTAEPTDRIHITLRLESSTKIK